MRALLCAALAVISLAQTPAPAPSDAFAGRWELTMKLASAASGVQSARPFLIVEITSPSTGISATIVDNVGATLITGKVSEVSVTDGQLRLLVDISGTKFTFQGRRNADQLEGTVRAEGETQDSTWVGTKTTANKVGSFEQVSPERKAEDASFLLAQKAPPGAERIAAYRKFLADFPKSNRRDDANLQIALSSPPAERGAALRRFLTDFPASRLKDEAEYQLLQTILNAEEKLAAEEKFVVAYPRSGRTETVTRQMIDQLIHAKPINEARVNAVIDRYIRTSFDMAVPVGKYTINARASTMNNVADQLMASDAMLERALEISQKAVALAGEKEEPESRTTYTTTLGEVLFKLKRYDEAGDTLKRAVQISGSDGDGETQLYLGKYYEVKNDEESALKAYMTAYEKGSPLDTKASLDRLYIKKYGSLATLNAKLDEAYLAKPKPFDPGHFERGRNGSGKVLLAELFTGAECGPCVGADFAFDGIGARYDRETVAVLVYHLHVPGPDPMTNDDTEARASLYGVRGTPTAVIDGSALPASGGTREMAGGLFNDYTSRIESAVALRPLASLTGFKATLTGDTINVTGEAALSADPGGPAKASLHVALVEDSVRYVGSNGVRFHTFVVRKLLGSAAGTPLAAPGSKTPYSESVTIASINAALDAYLGKYEKDTSEQVRGFTFKERVDRLDPKKLSVVVFVQDNQTKAVLQAKVVQIH